MPRYIDADKLNKKKKYCFQTQYGAFPKHEYFIKAQDLYEMPIADVEEVKHATWECTDESNNIWKCSGKDGCEEHFILYTGTPKDNKYKCCPNCGAKMDGKRGK